MRVLLQTDMEGVSQITDFRELIPLWDEYWEAGRPALTAEVAAATRGLFDGGASEVVIDDQHLGGPSNIISRRLPKRATMPGSSVIYQQLKDRAFDAVFQVGRHARWGTNEGFVAHTQMPGFSLAIDGALITECHICALRAQAPVLGITGDDRLEPQIDGVIAGTPFLPVKHSQGLIQTSPIHGDAKQSLSAIRTFARNCVRDWQNRPVPMLPESFTLSAFVGTSAARDLAGIHGLAADGDSVVSAHCSDWWNDAEPAVQAVTRAVAAPVFKTLGSLDMSSQAALRTIDPETLETARNLLVSWLYEPQVVWSTKKRRARRAAMVID